MELKDLLGEGDDDLLEGQEPFVIDDCVRIISIVRLIKDPTGVLWHNFYK
jgi:ubiquitin carboxyl-terminal hydrolase 7